MSKNIIFVLMYHRHKLLDLVDNVCFDLTVVSKVFEQVLLFADRGTVAIMKTSLFPEKKKLPSCNWSEEHWKFHPTSTTTWSPFCGNVCTSQANIVVHCLEITSQGLTLNLYIHVRVYFHFMSSPVHSKLF
jgi:hypothetical protein